MRLLLIHADRFAFAVTGKASVRGYAHDAAEADAQTTMDEVLVAFVAVESADQAGPADVAAQAAELILSTTDSVGASSVMIYPYAHLSSDLAAPRVASEVLIAIEGLCSAARPDIVVRRSPFGYYKSFEIACKGHPLSELARTLHPSDETTAAAAAPTESAALEAEKTLRSEWRIYSPDGTYVPADDYRFSGEDGAGLRQLYAYERAGSRAAEDAPPHIRLMREHELVDYEPASDTGNMRWYPRGILVKRLLEQHVTSLVSEYGGMEVETPLMYDYQHPALSKYLERFPARQYVVNSDDKEYFLRFAACFGQYMIMHDMVASHRDLPVRLYELTHHSFRREQGGEVAGLRRLRAFTMPDMHTAVADMAMAKKEFLEQVKLCLRWVDDIGVECVPAIRFVQSFLDENPDFVGELLEVLGRPALIEVWDERFFYFVTKFELNFVDNAKKAACLSTVQIDVENCERFDITYTADDGSRQTPLLLHTSISGSIDRNLYAILEHQAQSMAKGRKAEWPLWLAPTQVRLLPISPEHVDGAVRIARDIPFRTDVDDRDLRINKKVRGSEKEWVPYTVVVGDREVAGDATLTVRTRSGEQFTTTLEEFVARLRTEVGDRPHRPANAPLLMSTRPIFVG